jgi:hypothetical protein
MRIATLIARLPLILVASAAGLIATLVTMVAAVAMLFILPAPAILVLRIVTTAAVIAVPIVPATVLITAMTRLLAMAAGRLSMPLETPTGRIHHNDPRVAGIMLSGMTGGSPGMTRRHAPMTGRNVVRTVATAGMTHIGRIVVDDHYVAVVVLMAGIEDHADMGVGVHIAALAAAQRGDRGKRNGKDD